MLLRQEDHDGIAVLSVSGPVGEREADGLVTAAARIQSTDCRGVVVDLAGAGTVTDTARCRLTGLLDLPSGWPRSPLVLCPDGLLPDAPSAMVAADRDQALELVADRADRPRTRLTVPHDETGPGQARRAVTSSEHLGLDGLSDDVALVVSEMVTNAVRHAEPPVSLEVEATDDEIVVAVRDGSPDGPSPREVSEDEEGGRGMMLVQNLAAEHGVRRQPPGKTVWARIRRHRAT